MRLSCVALLLLVTHLFYGADNGKVRIEAQSKAEYINTNPDNQVDIKNARIDGEAFIQGKAFVSGKSTYIGELLGGVGTMGKGFQTMKTNPTNIPKNCSINTFIQDSVVSKARRHGFAYFFNGGVNDLSNYGDVNAYSSVLSRVRVLGKVFLRECEGNECHVEGPVDLESTNFEALYVYNYYHNDKYNGYPVNLSWCNIPYIMVKNSNDSSERGTSIKLDFPRSTTHIYFPKNTNNNCVYTFDKDKVKIMSGDAMIREPKMGDVYPTLSF